MTQVATSSHAATAPEPEPVPEGHVRLTIDGVSVIAPKGELVIRTAERIGTAIPRFCDHPLLEPVGACRQCLVEVEMGGRPMPKPQAVLHPDRRRRHGGQDPADLAGRGEGAARPTWSSCCSTTRWTARSATRAASARCRTRRWPTVRRAPGCATRSGCSSSRSPSPPRSCWTGNAACCASAAPGSPTRSPATSSSTCWNAVPRSRSGSTRPSRSSRTSPATPSRSARSAR